MNVQSTDSQIVKSVGASGQMSLGKEFAGRQVLVESPAKRVWIIRTATIISDHEEWLPEAQTKSRLKKAVAWAQKNPPKVSNPDLLPVVKAHATKRSAAHFQTNPNNHQFAKPIVEIIQMREKYDFTKA
jgi:hypothetical protein